ncbi:SDR family oxidoreductase [Crocinitomicaceae bacterium CZZ-1]|uniref:dTDP-4-dehydrorhamnose reductase n=1 Tax=Taishania pollutisoli TaxID=2766479 RepID=A0A8J6PIZ5_9FLAO|nr:SDR family oxidoreductase [Taishania pollutisoli]MBC9811925.1 SDR family oxidoreductase [Taishania pollutisoli]
MKILITGANGLLGQKITGQLVKRNIPFLATSNGANRNPDCPDADYKTMNICNAAEVAAVVATYQPTHIIHTAAMTNVDACELNPEACREVNVEGTRHVADAARSVGAHFQLLSTDFVFDGEKGNYSEEDEVGPLSVYAQSKVDAEELLLKGTDHNFSIVRTIIVYGTAHNLSRSNLFLWAREALPKGEQMNVVDDQFRAPTWADDLAWGCIRICELNATGIYHLSGPETYSIFEIVQKVAAHYGYGTRSLNRIASATLNQPAKRPPKTGFDLTKAKNKLNYHPKTIEETLHLF